MNKKVPIYMLQHNKITVVIRGVIKCVLLVSSLFLLQERAMACVADRSDIFINGGQLLEIKVQSPRDAPVVPRSFHTFPLIERIFFCNIPSRWTVRVSSAPGRTPVVGAGRGLLQLHTDEGGTYPFGIWLRAGVIGTITGEGTNPDNNWHTQTGTEIRVGEPVYLENPLGGHSGMGLRAEFQTHVTRNIRPGSYYMPSQYVGDVSQGSSATLLRHVAKIWSPPIRFTLEAIGCEISVPSEVDLGIISKNTLGERHPFQINFRNCHQRIDSVNTFLRFSDAAVPQAANTGGMFINTANSQPAKGYSLLIRDTANRVVPVIPVGTGVHSGEISLGRGSTNSVNFTAEVVEDGNQQTQGHLEFTTIVGVSYR